MVALSRYQSRLEWKLTPLWIDKGVELCFETHQVASSCGLSFTVSPDSPQAIYYLNQAVDGSTPIDCFGWEPALLLVTFLARESFGTYKRFKRRGTQIHDPYLIVKEDRVLVPFVIESILYHLLRFMKKMISDYIGPVLWLRPSHHS